MTRRSCSSASAASRSSSGPVKTWPVGFCGLQSTRARHRPSAAARSAAKRSWSKAQPDGRALGRDGEDRPGHLRSTCGGTGGRRARAARRSESAGVARWRTHWRPWMTSHTSRTCCGVRRPAEAGRHALGEERAQRRAGQPVGVAEVAGVDEPVERGDDGGRGGEVHVGHPARRAGRDRGAATWRPAWPAARRGPARRSPRRRPRSGRRRRCGCYCHGPAGSRPSTVRRPSSHARRRAGGSASAAAGSAVRPMGRRAAQAISWRPSSRRT